MGGTEIYWERVTKGGTGSFKGFTRKVVWGQKNELTLTQNEEAEFGGRGSEKLAIVG